MFKLWAKQEGEGCGYMVGCGEKLFNLNSTTRDEAKVEAKKVLLERTGSEQEFETAFLLESVEDITYLANEATSEFRANVQEELKAVKREQLARLKRELGEE